MASDPSPSPLLAELADGVLTLTLNRPARRNALSIALVDHLHAALDAFEADPAQRVLVLTGTPPGFCAGLDLEDFARPDAPRAPTIALITRLPRLRKPSIAAVNGAAITGGLELALGCDIILAGETARFADSHMRINTVSGSGMAARLMRAVGAGWCRQMMLSAEPIDAATALRIGLINELVPADGLLTRAHALARSIASHDPALVATMKAVLEQGSLGTLDALLAAEAAALATRKAGGATGWNAAAVIPNATHG